MKGNQIDVDDSDWLISALG